MTPLRIAAEHILRSVHIRFGQVVYDRFVHILKTWHAGRMPTARAEYMLELVVAQDADLLTDVRAYLDYFHRVDTPIFHAP